MEVEAASFNTLMDSMSWIDKVDKALSTWIPSTTYRGELSCVIEPPPLTRMRTCALGEPSEPVTCTPASLPARDSSAEFRGMSFRSREVTEDTEASTSFLLTDW